MTAHETAPPGDSDDSWSSTDAVEISQPDTRRRRILVLPIEPFLIITIVLCLELIIGLPHASRARRAAGVIGAGVYLIAALANLAYLYPILTAKVIPYSAWLSRMCLATGCSLRQ